MVGKVDDHVRGTGVLCQAGHKALSAAAVHGGGQRMALSLDQAADLLPHTPGGTVYDDIHSRSLSPLQSLDVDAQGTHALDHGLVVVLFHGDQRQPQEVLAVAHRSHGGLHGDGVALAEQGADQGHVLAL